MKALFFDIDGTLLSEKTHCIPNSAIEALKQAQNNGHLIFINTGRPYASVPNEIKTLNYDGIICGCGTYIEYKKEVLMHQSLSHVTCQKIVEALRKYHVYGLLEGKEAVYYDIDNTHPEVAQIKKQHLNNGIDNSHTWDDDDLCFDKMTIWYDQKSDFNGFKEAGSDIFDYIERQDGFGEFVPHGHTKASAITYIINHLNINHENTYAFGDSTNDIAMLQEAKHSVALLNSHPQVLQSAEFITKDVDDNGIAYALKHYHLID